MGKSREGHFRVPQKTALEVSVDNDQFGFRKDRRIDDGLGMFENMVGKVASGTSPYGLPF